jgi:hypothetical protein
MTHTRMAEQAVDNAVLTVPFSQHRIQRDRIDRGWRIPEALFDCCGRLS